MELRHSNISPILSVAQNHDNGYSMDLLLEIYNQGYKKCDKDIETTWSLEMKIVIKTLGLIWSSGFYKLDITVLK